MILGGFGVGASEDEDQRAYLKQGPGKILRLLNWEEVAGEDDFVSGSTISVTGRR